jgi:hypothetical protein
MTKWGLISKYDFIPRFEYLSEFLSSQLSFPNEFQVLDCDPQEFSEKLVEWQSEFAQLRVGPPFGAILAADLDRSNALTLSLKTADCSHQIDNRWWPRSLLEEGLLRAIIRSKLEINIHSKAMIIGTGTSAKAAILPLIKLGFNKFSFTETDTDTGYAFVQNMRQRIFNVEFDFIERRDISLLPGSYSMVVNTTPDMKENVLLDDLSFFNYLKAGGVAIDLSVHKKETKFVSNALLASAQVLPGTMVASEVDAYWAHMCFDLELDLEAYEQGLLERLG